MLVTFDIAKSLRNIALRGLSFKPAVAFDFENALIFADERRDYGERRYIAVGYLDSRLHVLCFTHAIGGIRVISFRKANDREAKRYAKALTRN